MRIHSLTLVQSVVRRTGFVVVAGVGVLLGASPAHAVINGPTQVGEICMQKVFGTPVKESNLINCTANDIRLSRAISVTPDTCTAGETFNLIATFETVVTANSRYDAGFFFRIDGGSNARGDGDLAIGKCSLSALDPAISPALELDGDSCGDLNSSPIGDPHEVTFEIPGVLCKDSDGDGFLNLPNCTSWHNKAGTSCSTDPNGDFDIGEAMDFHPDTKSKCVCDDTFQVPVLVEDATITVLKTAVPTTIPEPGGDVTYKVVVTNSSQFESVTITSLQDAPIEELGDLLDANNPNFVDNDCPTKLKGAVLLPGDSATCQFTAAVVGNADDEVTDTVTACGTQSGKTGEVCGSGDATVTITDVATAPTVTKAAGTPTCYVEIDVPYQVVVHNHSTVDDLTVNLLNDNKFGDITVEHVAENGFEQVLSTTCADANGYVIEPSGNYSCSFVGRIISDTCDGAHSNVVTADVTDDDGNSSSPTHDAQVSW